MNFHTPFQPLMIGTLSFLKTKWTEQIKSCNKSRTFWYSLSYAFLGKLALLERFYLRNLHGLPLFLATKKRGKTSFRTAVLGDLHCPERWHFYGQRVPNPNRGKTGELVESWVGESWVGEVNVTLLVNKKSLKKVVVSVCVELFWIFCFWNGEQKRDCFKKVGAQGWRWQIGKNDRKITSPLSGGMPRIIRETIGGVSETCSTPVPFKVAWTQQGHWRDLEGGRIFRSVVPLTWKPWGCENLVSPWGIRCIFRSEKWGANLEAQKPRYHRVVVKDLEPFGWI